MFLVGPQQLVPQIEENLRDKSSVQITPKDGEYMLQEPRRSPLQRCIGLSGALQSSRSSNMDEEAWYGLVGGRRGREVLQEL